MKKLWCLVLMLASVSLAKGEESSLVVDVPTAYITEYGGYTARFRFYSDGGMLSRVSFGVLTRLELGFAWDLEQVIGSDDINVNEPSLNVKLRFYDGTLVLPALALGYDGQGYFFDEDLDEYTQREKGIFLAATQELFFPKLELTIGANIFDFSEDVIYGLGGLTYTMHPIMLKAEMDNIHHIKHNRINAGIALLLGGNISVDLAGRDLGAEGRDAERIIRINYRGLF